MKILSELPTERAMKDMERARVTPAIRKVVETMALQKLDLVRVMRHIQFREALHAWKTDGVLRANDHIANWLKDNPNYTVDLHAND